MEHLWLWLLAVTMAMAMAMAMATMAVAVAMAMAMAISSGRVDVYTHIMVQPLCFSCIQILVTKPKLEGQNSLVTCLH